MARRAHWVGLAAVTVALAVLPGVAGPSLTSQVGRFLVYGLVALSLDLIWGYTGQLSLGHAAFFGLGAYGSGLVLARTGWVAAGPIAVLVGIAVPALLALVMGRILFGSNVVGAYFAIITLLVSLIVESLAVTFIGLTGGINGLYGMQPLRLGPLEIGSPRSAYYLVLVSCAVLYAAAKLLVDSPLGRAMDGIRLNEARVESLGYPTAAIRTVVFTIGCGMAGYGGVLYAVLERFVYPAQLGILFSTAIIVWLAIGGRRSLVGAFLGAFLVNQGESLLSGGLEQYWVLATGALLILVVLTQPRGMVGLLDPLLRRRGSAGA